MTTPTTRSEAQAEASRQNGSKSNGPATEDGRQRSAQNGRKHGLCSDALSFASDDERDAYLDLHRAHLDRYQPIDAAEAACIDRISMAVWRQSLADGLEARYLNAAMSEDEDALAQLPSLATLCRYRARIARDYTDAMQSLQELQGTRPFDLALARMQEAKRTRQDTAPDDNAASNIVDLADPGGTDEPDHVESLPDRPGEPLNREERRRLEAMRRKLT